MEKKTMTGLEAIEFMKQGGKVAESNDRKAYYEIQEDTVWYVTPTVMGEAVNFDFSITYVEYKPKPLTGWERVGENESYYSINGNSYVEEMTEDMCMEDKYYYEDANYFSTEEKAEEINFKQTLFRKLQRFSDENGGSKIDYSRGSCQHKWFIEYDKDDQLFLVSCYYDVRVFGTVYFSSKEVAYKAIEKFKDNLIKYFTTHD